MPDWRTTYAALTALRFETNNERNLKQTYAAALLSAGQAYDANPFSKPRKNPAFVSPSERTAIGQKHADTLARFTALLTSLERATRFAATAISFVPVPPWTKIAPDYDPVQQRVEDLLEQPAAGANAFIQTLVRPLSFEARAVRDVLVQIVIPPVVPEFLDPQPPVDPEPGSPAAVFLAAHNAVTSAIADAQLLIDYAAAA